jgi:glycosyltransferase involved in cell wall biosynthesis
MTIAVCMIVKNEAEVLPRCLDSIVGLWDELIIVDTGSQDGTVGIAEAYGARVYHYDWIAPGNKGEARNVGINEAVSQWIVVIDADEVIQNAAEVRTEILRAKADALAVQFNNFINGAINLSWKQIRVFRRGQFAYKYREHEIPVAKAANPVIADSNIAFEHRAPEGRATGKGAPMLARLAADAMENPTDPHPLYFYHRELVNQGDYIQAIEMANRYLSLTENGGYIRGDVYGNLAIAYEKIGRIDKARECLHMAAACEPNRRLWLYRLALLHSQCQEWQIALAMLRAAAELPNGSHESNPNELAQIYNLIGYCQHEMLHSMAHSH